MASVTVKDITGDEFVFPDAHFRTDDMGELTVFIDPSDTFAAFGAGQWVSAVRHG